jgi:hypothetical protein
MNRLLYYINQNLRTILILCAFVLTSVLVIYLLPPEGRFMFEYQKGGYWKHEDLMAPFNFPVYKTRRDLAHEQDSAIRSFRPIFQVKHNIGEARLQELADDFSKAWITYTLQTFKITSEEVYRKDARYAVNRQLEYEYRKYLRELAGEIYKSGIIDLSPLEVNGRFPYQEIMLMVGNVAEAFPVSSFYTPRTAYEFMAERLKNSIPKKGNAVIRQYNQFFQELELNNYLSINVIYDAAKSASIRKNLLSEISLTRGLIQEGQGIIARGEYISDEKFLVLESLRQEYERNLGFIARQLITLGKFILVLVSFLLVFFFLRSFRREVLRRYRNVAFILLIMVMMILIASATLQFKTVSINVLPFTILPILLKVFFDSRLALFVHILTILLIGSFVPNSFEFVLLNTVAGMVAIISLTEAYRRSIFFVTSLYVMATCSLVYLGIALIQEGDVSAIQWSTFGWFAGNSLLILITYPLIYLFEKTFGFVSDATLMELSDTNQPLLRRLAELAPGTFQHSLQVANLAEDAVFKVGGNPLLVRAGALYHDIGKMEDPLYYIENQSSAINPHDNLDFEQSAQIIIDHVKKGVDMARKFKLPEPVIDFIRTHHGTTTVQYFYKSFLSRYPEKEVDQAIFSYPGPRPLSKETAIVMMADSVEAASRSLKTISESTVDKLVDSIIFTHLTEEQYNLANITFQDITTIREVFKKRLRNMYHVRISYPK